MTIYKQARLERWKLDGSRQHACFWLPTKGTNGRALAVGRTVTLVDDPDQNPWNIVGLSTITRTQHYFDRKRAEGKRRQATTV